MNNDFNSHTREGVTVQRWRLRQRYLYFNSHTREGVTILLLDDLIFSPFQLTHP